jgi:hypothetical protein
MRLFVNLFLILFVADGSLSVLDELVCLFSGNCLLSAPRNMLADLVILSALIVYFSMGIDKRIPKKVFVPMTLFVLCCPLFGWLLPSLAETRFFGLGTALAQLALTVLPFLHFRGQRKGGFLITRDMFRPPFFCVRNTLYFVLPNLLLIPVILVLFAMATANAYLAVNTAGFVRLAPSGLYMRDRVYQKGHKTVRLVGMIHFGQKEYYDDLVRSISSARTVVLAEGVTDEKNLLRNKFGYGEMAGILGLTSQDKMQFRGRMVKAEDIGHASSVKTKPASGRPDIVSGDVDIRTFDASTILFLNVMARYMTAGRSQVDGIKDFYAWANKNVTPEMNRTIMNDILYRRNKEVIRLMDKALVGYDSVVVPWGALHLPEIERAVLGRGFVLRAEKEKESINFSRVLIHKLSGNSSKVDTRHSCN